MSKNSVYHLSIAVSDGTRSKKFYDELFRFLDWKTVYEDNEAGGYSDGNFTLWVIPAEKKETKHEFHSVGFHHLAIRVPTVEMVNKTFKWCKEHNIKVVDAPAKYPKYTKDYYAVFFLDPDGLKLEVVYNPISD